MQNVPQIRVFLASPGDVNEERVIALEVLDMLEYDPLFKRDGAGGVSIHAVAWDKPGGDTPMRVTMTPQTAIKEGLPRPSQCDIVLILFWGRMGTPLPYPEYQKDDGSPYLSGTEWEFWDAVNAERTHGKPITLLYRCTEDPHINMKDREQIAQYHTVLDFFAQFRDQKTNALIGGMNEYKNPEDLRRKLINHLRITISNILSDENQSHADTGKTAPTVSTPRPQVEAQPLWEGSPFPGLRAFTPDDAPIFFGRGAETSELLKRVEANRFTAIIGASGSGKSSLAAAGLIPRLRGGAIITGQTNSKTWRYARVTPGNGGDPFGALFAALCAAFPEHAVSPFMVVQEKRTFVESIVQDPRALIDICNALLREAKAPAWAEILFFIDQFEELFTVVEQDDRGPFIALLGVICTSGRLRCVATMRSDFYANCLELPELAMLLKDATYPLAAPTAGALYEMITRPADRAGLQWDENLQGRILNDTGSEAGALALMAYALDELYKVSHTRADRHLTFDAYTSIGGVSGAIGKRAEATFERLNLPDPDKERLLQRVFRELVFVNENGTATRQRAASSRFDPTELALIRAFADARLLVTYDETVEVAHEAVFRSWERLREWIKASQEDLILLRQVRAAADEWMRKKQPDFLRWPAERLKPVYEMIERQEPSLSEHERNFIELEQNRLLREIADIRTDHKRRRWIGERLATIGDPRYGVGLDERGMPQIDWLPVMPNSEIEIKGQRFILRPFYVARYPITHLQFQAFLDAPDGFNDVRWWRGFPLAYVKQTMSVAVAQYDNYPRDTVSWYQCVAFTHWLNAKYREHGLFGQFVAGNWQLRLPAEWEWQWMAQNGVEGREYPWGTWDEHPRANTTEAGIGDHSTAVGMYPDGAAACGALDVTGNLYEWCLNKYQDVPTVQIDESNEPRALRGGSSHYDRYRATCVHRFNFIPFYWVNDHGFRVIVGPPSESE